MSPRIALVVDDDEVFRQRLSRALGERGWIAHPCEDGAEAMRRAAEQSPDLAVVDLRLPGPMTGLDIVRELRMAAPEACILMLTGYGSIATALIATKLGADHYLNKPADADQIVAAYERARLGVEPAWGESHETDVPSLARVEWEHIQRVLAECDGNISQAAKLLGLHRRSLQRKLSKYPPRT